MKYLVFLSFILSLIFSAYGQVSTGVKGQWKGVKMFQDEKLNEEKAYFLPNDGYMILDEESINLYYYPYFKSVKYPVKYGESSLKYTINDKEIVCDYSFKGDTLEFKMKYIGKVFLKRYLPAKLDQLVVQDLDNNGFRTEKLRFEYELDTFNLKERQGFEDYDSLNFKPIQYIQFLGGNSMRLNRSKTVTFEKGFKTLSFYWKSQEYKIGVRHLSGTQSIHLVPISQCQCDSLSIPYMTVKWADRKRQAIIDEENF